MILTTKANGDAILKKDKLYLHNPNIAYVLGDTDADKGNLRECVNEFCNYRDTNG